MYNKSLIVFVLIVVALLSTACGDTSPSEACKQASNPDAACAAVAQAYAQATAVGLSTQQADAAAEAALAEVGTVSAYCKAALFSNATGGNMNVSGCE